MRMSRPKNDGALPIPTNCQVHAGRCDSASDVVREGPQLLEKHKAKARALQDALIAGERSGKPQLFDFEAFKLRKRANYES